VRADKQSGVYSWKWENNKRTGTKPHDNIQADQEHDQDRGKCGVAVGAIWICLGVKFKYSVNRFIVITYIDRKA